MPHSGAAPRVATAIAEHIEKLILEGALRPGEKLAPERELAEKLGVSRPTLRDAIHQLADRGLLATSRSGTHVASFLAPLIDPLANLLTEKPQVTEDYFEFRRCLEAEAAGLAAVRANAHDRKAIGKCLERMRLAHAKDDPSEEVEADIELHMGVYEASHNLVLLHVMRALSELLRRDIIYNREQLYRGPGNREVLYAQHRALAEAVVEGRPDAAKSAAADHIKFTSQAIERLRRECQRMEASLHRINRSDLLAK